MSKLQNYNAGNKPHYFNIIFKLVITVFVSVQFCQNALTKETEISEHIIIDGFPYGMFVNGHFSRKIPAGWYYCEWSRGGGKKKQRGGMVSKFGFSRAVEIPACDKGMIGWTSNFKEILNPFRPVTVTGKVRHEEDYKGSEPRVFFTFFKDRKKFIGTKFIKTSSNSKNWSEFKFVLRAEDVPENANWFRLNIVSMARKSQSGPAGNAYFADVKAKVAAANGNQILLRPDKPVSCWNIKEKVIFKLEGNLPAGTTALAGTLFDSKGQQVTEKKIPVERIKQSGWQWQPEKARFYTLKFTLVTATGRKPVSEDYIATAWKTADRTVFNRSSYNVAVFSRPRRKPADVPAEFGINASMPDLVKNRDSLASVKQFEALLGQLDFNFIRWHNVSWSSLERKSKGDFQWHNLDNHINWAHKKGYTSVINFYKTPKWASPVKDSKISIMAKYSTYAPADLQDWSDFINAMVKRYQNKVNIWEVWNEPHLPGSSVFWNDTPENFVKLLKTAYVTIKEVQPESKVWLGGIGMRYLPFYKRIIKLGAGEYFDFLSLHGPKVSPEPFWEMDKKLNSPNHPWVNSEWHASLVRFNDANYRLNDRQLTYNLLKDAMRQLKLKVQRITYFDLSSPAFREILDLYSRNFQILSHHSGLLVRKPFPQPKFQCQAWQTFTSMFSGKIDFKGEFLIEKVKIAALQSGNGPLLIIWHDEAKPIQLPPELKTIIGNDAKISNWEGAPSLNNTLVPFTMYYIENPLKLPGKKFTCNDTLAPLRVKRVLNNRYRGIMNNFKLFELKTGKLNDGINWNYNNFAMKGTKVSLAKPRFALGVTPSFLDLVVELEDEAHHIVKGWNAWEGDSIQFAFDPPGYGLRADRLEFFTVNSKTGLSLFKLTSPDIYGDLPNNWSPPRNPTRFANILLLKNGNKTRYLIRIPNCEVYPYRTENMMKELRFSLLINDNDGDGRKGWIEWGAGIGDNKDPVQYGTLSR